MRCFSKITITRIPLHLLFECTGPITLFLGAKTAFFGRRTREHGATFDPFDRLPGTLRQAQGKLARDRQVR